MAIINQQNFQIKNGNDWYKLCPFPVGFIYLSQNSTSPATTFGGTWSALTDSKFLRPSGSWNSTGGSSTIAINNMPSHNHAYNGDTWVAYWGSESGASSSEDWNGSGWGCKGGGNLTTTSLTGIKTGGGKAYWQPYRTCYCWYRTA